MKSLRSLLLALLALPALPAAARAQFIFYDNDNSRIYSNNTFYSAGDITSSQYARGNDVYATSGWLVNNASGAGLYNENLGTHFYANGNGWNLNASRLLFRPSYESGNYGSLYSDGSSFGVLNDGGSWAMYATGASQLVRFPGSIQIATYGGIQDVNSYSSYGSIALDVAKNGYYGMLFGSATSDPNLMFDGGGNGGFYYENWNWMTYWNKGARNWTINGTVNATTVANSVGIAALTKVVYRTYCNGGGGLCYPPGCPNGTTQAGSGSSALSSGFVGYRDCCFGSD